MKWDKMDVQINEYKNIEFTVAKIILIVEKYVSLSNLSSSHNAKYFTIKIKQRLATVAFSFQKLQNIMPNPGKYTCTKRFNSSQ